VCAIAPLMMGVSLAGTALSAAGQVMQGKQANAAAQLQQQEYGRQAEEDRVAAAYEASREAAKGQAQQSQALTQVGSSGVMLSGSPTEVLADNAAQNSMDVEAIMYGSKIRQNQLERKGILTAWEGKQKKKAGYLGAATTALSGIGSLYRPQNSVQMGGSTFA
jgi:hypothetical protein